MPKRLLQAAPSRLVTYLDCPRRYRFSYLDRPPPPKGPPWAHNSLGAAVHTALANWWKLPAAAAHGRREPASCSTTPGCPTASATRRSATPPGSAPATMVDGVRRRARPCRRANRGRADGRAEDRPRRAVRPGRPDRRPGERGAGDRRLQDRAPPAHRRRRPHVAGAGGVRRRGRAHAAPRAAVASSCTTCRPARCVAWEHTDEGLARHIRRADSIAAEIAELDLRFRAGVSEAEADAMYPATVSSLCGWCDYNRVCSAGSAAASPRDPGPASKSPNPPTRQILRPESSVLVVYRAGNALQGETSGCHRDGMAHDARYDELDSALDTMVKERDLSGTVLLTRAGETLFEECYGLADRAAELRITPRTRFGLASVTKLFTDRGRARPGQRRQDVRRRPDRRPAACPAPPVDAADRRDGASSAHAHVRDRRLRRGGRRVAVVRRGLRLALGRQAGLRDAAAGRLPADVSATSSPIARRGRPGSTPTPASSCSAPSSSKSPTGPTSTSSRSASSIVPV